VRALDLTGAERHRSLDVRDNRRVDVRAVLDRLGKLASEALDAVHVEGLRPVGATVALPGLVDAARGTLLVAPNLGWNDVAVVDELLERIPSPPTPAFPLAADNEANLAALAELWEGTARGLSDVLYVSGEIGVGAGIIIDGELFRGSQGFGGEFGHMTVDPNGPACACGSRGCPETLAGLEPLLEAAGLDPADAGTTTGSGEPVSDLATRARMGDQQALTALREAGGWLGLGIASAANLLNFQAVVLGGFFAQLATWLAAPIARELETHVLASEWGVPRLLPSTLGPEAAVRGAAALSLRRVLTDPASAEVA
jgi:predicted NBD/HSP70 family sugar kinase